MTDMACIAVEMPDHCILNTHDYVIAGVNGQPYFDSAAFGLTPITQRGDCSRGYICTYVISENRVYLHNLQVVLGQYVVEGCFANVIPHQGPPINGVVPSVNQSQWAFFTNSYEAIGLEVPFTGGLLLVDGCSEEVRILHVLNVPGVNKLHLRSPTPWNYTTIIELVCEAGKLLKVRDVSQRVAEIRNKRMRREELKGWIDSTFRFDYDLLERRGEG